MVVFYFESLFGVFATIAFGNRRFPIRTTNFTNRKRSGFQYTAAIKTTGRHPKSGEQVNSGYKTMVTFFTTLK